MVEVPIIFLSDHLLVFSLKIKKDAINAERPMPPIQVTVIGFSSTPNHTPPACGSEREMLNFFIDKKGLENFN